MRAVLSPWHKAASTNSRPRSLKNSARVSRASGGQLTAPMVRMMVSSEGLKVNVTLCFSPVQAMLAAKAGATFISPFIGRVDDVGEDGMGLIRDIRTIYDNYGFKTEILAASVRHVHHVREAALSGADVSTIPSSVFKQLYNHTLTDKGLAAFLADAQKANVVIKG